MRRFVIYLLLAMWGATLSPVSVPSSRAQDAPDPAYTLHLYHTTGNTKVISPNHKDAKTIKLSFFPFIVFLLIDNLFSETFHQGFSLTGLKLRYFNNTPYLYFAQ